MTISQLDHALSEAYYKLAGANLEGKTRVFDGGAARDGMLWWFTERYPANCRVPFLLGIH